jgi:hypothetical protein
MRTQRQVVDYSLQKRAVLREVYAGRMGLYEVCDASPYLKNAARFHGEPTEDRCPICRRENLTLVHYIYGDELRQSAGQARSRSELVALAAAVREFQVYVVEVCRGCDWNHLAEQYLLGHAVRVDAAAGNGPDGTGLLRPDGAPAAATVRHGRPAASARVMAVAAGAGTSGRRKRGARA